MLKTTGGTESATNPKEIKGEVSSDSVVGKLVDGGEATNSTKGKN